MPMKHSAQEKPIPPRLRERAAQSVAQDLRTGGAVVLLVVVNRLWEVNHCQ